MKANRPPKFNPTKSDLIQMEEVFNHFMKIADEQGISRKTVEGVVLGLVRRLFKERQSKNWYKAELSKRDEDFREYR